MKLLLVLVSHVRFHARRLHHTHWHRAKKLLAKIGPTLDATLFSAIVAYARSRMHLLGLLGLLILLMADNNPILQLKGGNYANLLCGIVACFLLREQVIHHRHVRKKLDAIHRSVLASSSSPASDSSSSDSPSQQQTGDTPS